MRVERAFVMMFGQQSCPKAKKNINITPGHLGTLKEEFGGLKLKAIFIWCPVIDIRIGASWRRWSACRKVSPLFATGFPYA
jgi:phage terminase large subunit-like protein